MNSTFKVTLESRHFSTEKFQHSNSYFTAGGRGADVISSANEAR